jgi:hypothetical protein
MTRPRRRFIDKVYVCTLSHKSISRPVPRGENKVYASVQSVRSLKQNYIDEQFIMILRAGQSEFDSRERLELLFSTSCPDLLSKGYEELIPRMWSRPLASSWHRCQVCAGITLNAFMVWHLDADFTCTLIFPTLSIPSRELFRIEEYCKGLVAIQHYVHMM